MEGGQVRIGDEKLIGNAFVMMGLAGKTVVLLCEPTDVECWANLARNGGLRNPPPENPIFPPTALRVSAVTFSYTENSCFPYTRQPCCD